MADLLIADSDRDALVAAGLLLGSTEGAPTLRVVSSMMEMTRLLHDLRRVYTRITICGVPAADSGSLRSALTVLQVRGTRVWWFDSHDLLWTSEVRSQLDQLGVEVRLPSTHRPETERTSGLVLAHLLDVGDSRTLRQAARLRAAIAESRARRLGGPDWLALVDAVEHDHRLLTHRVIRAALMRVWEQDAPYSLPEQRLVALQRSRETRVGRFLDRLAAEADPDQELLRFDAEKYAGLRYVRPRMYTEAARRALRAQYAVARVGRGWVFACRDEYAAGLDLLVAFLERLFDLDVAVRGYPYRATVQVEGGADVDDRLLKVVETALEEERSGRRQPPPSPIPDEDMDW